MWPPGDSKIQRGKLEQLRAERIQGGDLLIQKIRFHFGSCRVIHLAVPESGRGMVGFDMVFLAIIVYCALTLYAWHTENFSAFRNDRRAGYR